MVSRNAVIGLLGIGLLAAFVTGAFRGNGDPILSQPKTIQEIINPTTLSNFELVSTEKSIRIEAIDQLSDLIKTKLSQAQSGIIQTVSRPTIPLSNVIGRSTISPPPSSGRPDTPLNRAARLAAQMRADIGRSAQTRSEGFESFIPLFENQLALLRTKRSELTV